ncbi:MAG: T9SS type A sorting domain-containing protein, partial [Cyclobacteriaceae bacterium]|nr:T9SS type A sorting domain-containing protein [Cyclobacteriaceae bacterium]
PVIQFTIKNFSTVPVTSFQMQYSLNGGAVVRQDFNNVQLALGEQKNFNLNAVSLNPGNNPITLSVNNPNGLPDSSPSNNTLAFNSYLDRSTDATPLRVTFDNPQEKPWIIASPPSAATWQSVATNKRQSIVYTGFTNTRKGDEAWFVSPVLDLTRYQKHSLFFDESYALNAPATERLKILGSDDCGLTYKTVLYDREGTEFSITNSSSAWTPSVLTDWRRSYVRLDTMSGKSNVRLAFVVTNQNGNNLYLDNLEIFAGSDINPPVTSVPYQLYYSSRDLQSDVALTFNLPEKKDVRLQVYSLMGQLIADNILPATLNQTYYFDLSNQPTGIYLFRLQIDNQITATKVFIGH